MKELLKKDILLNKMNLLFTTLMMILFPIFLKMAVDNKAQALILPSAISLTISLLGLMVLNSVVDEDWKNPKSLAYLVSIGYRREDLILSKFLFAILWFFGLCGIYVVLSYMVGGLPKVDGEMFLYFLANYLFLVGLYLFFTILFGVSVGKIFFTFIVFLISLGPQFLKIILQKKHITLDLEKIINSTSILTFSLVSIGVFILIYFLCLSAFKKREL